MRRSVAVREGIVIGAVAASTRPRPVVVATPMYGPAPVVVAPPPVVYNQPPVAEVVVQTQAPGMAPPMAPPMAPGYPPPAGYQPGYPPQPGVYVDPMLAPRPMAPAPMVVGPPMGPGGAAMAAGVGVGAAVAMAERRHFYMVSEANGSVLGVERGGLKPGTHLVLERRRPDRAFHQIWYLDLEGVIRSKLNDFALESTKREERIRLMPYMGDARQQWTLEGNRIVNKVFRTECLGLRKHLLLKDDADVIMSAYEGKPFQHWRMEPCVI